MKKLPMLLVLVEASVFGAQSVTPSGPYTLSVTLPYASWTTISATQAMRWEFRLHDFGPDWPGSSGVVRLGPVTLYSTGPNGAFMASRGVDTFASNGSVNALPGCCAGRTDVLVRVQRDPANSRYTWELWNTTGGGYLLQTPPVSSFSTLSWAGLNIIVSSGKMDFLRWFSSTVPLGTSVPAVGVTGDLGDWEFEGNLSDSSGHGLNMSDSLATYATTPVYPPTCSAGNQVSFRAGYPGQLDATASSALDGGVGLSYVWQQLAGPAVIWSRKIRLGLPTVGAQTVSQPTITGLVAGSYTFQLTVKDSSGQSSVCTVNDGAVVTDDHDVVITNLPAVDTLLGPMVRYGANPWPWFDNRHKAEADLQIANMDLYYGAYWNVADPGTVTVATGSTTVTGVATTFTTTFCQGPGNPTVPQSGAAIVVWYPNGDLAGDTGRREMSIVSCTSDTSMTLKTAWDSSVSAGIGLQYSDNSTSGTWAYNAAPANYYDNVAAFYALYYRSGIVDYLNAARKLADRFWTCPQTDRGNTYLPAGGMNEAAWPNRSEAVLGLVLRANDSRADMWPGLSSMNQYDLGYALDYYAEFLPGMYDGREQAYGLARVSYCALYNPDATMKSNCKAWISSALTRIWTPARFADGGWHQWFASSESGAPNGWGPSSSAALTNGSANVTGTNTSWSSSDVGGLIWFTNGCTGSVCPRPSSNAGGDTAVYTVNSVGDSTHLTLNTTYAGTTGTHGWAIEDTSTGSMVIGYGQLPYMMGLLSFAFDMASQAIADTDPISSATYRAYNVDAANWVKTYGYRAPMKGLYYFAQFVNCQAPISESNTGCTKGNRPDTGHAGVGLRNRARDRGGVQIQRRRLAEDLRRYALQCAVGQADDLSIGIDDLRAGRSYVNSYDDGGWYMTGTPPTGDTPKWFGQAFGVSALSAWPAVPDRRTAITACTAGLHGPQSCRGA
jgi:hypothetical protein